MALRPDIIANNRQLLIPVQTPAETEAKYFTLRDLQRKDQAGTMQMAEAQRLQQQARDVRQIFSTATSVEDAITKIRAKGYHDVAQKLQTDYTAQQKAVADKQQVDLENSAKQLDAIGAAALAAKGKGPQAWQVQLARLHAAGFNVAKLPTTMSDDELEQLAQGAISAKDQLDAQNKDRNTKVNEGELAIKQNAETQKKAEETAGAMLPGTEFTTDQGERAAMFRVRQSDGSYKNETRVLGKQGAAPRAPVPGTDTPYSQDVFAQKEALARAQAQAAAAASEPPVAVMGDEGKPVLVRRRDSYGRTPANNREQGRNVVSGDANRIADFDTSLDDVKVLRAAVSPKGATGARAKAGAMLPNVVTELTGWGADAKSQQAVIDRVKQVIGKALEGGVLRKEDEYKYEKILPTIGDPASVVQSKLDGLEKAIRDRRLTLLDSLEDANYDVSKYRARTAPPNEGTDKPAAPAKENPFRKKKN